MDDQTKNLIQNHIDNNEVCLFMKGTPDAPQCGFSMAVSNILKILDIKFQGINVLEDQNLREGIKVFSDWPTIPQLYIKKEFVGGCDIVKEMYENGELKKILEEKGIDLKKLSYLIKFLNNLEKNFLTNVNLDIFSKLFKSFSIILKSIEFSQYNSRIKLCLKYLESFFIDETVITGSKY